MTTHGFLVDNHQGQRFLLTTEACPKTETHRLVVLQHVGDTWEPVTGRQAQAYRASVIGAFIDFFVDIGRVLNSIKSKSKVVSRSSPRSRHSRVMAASPSNRWSTR